MIYHTAHCISAATNEYQLGLIFLQSFQHLRHINK